LNVPFDRLEPLANVRVETGVGEGDRPVLNVGAQQLKPLPAFRHDEVV
jgi:hypothetical protein